MKKFGKQSSSFFYSVSMLFAGSEHAGKGLDDIVYYYNVLYNMMMVQSDIARLQAESVTKDRVLISKISEEIIKTYSPSIINYEDEGKMCMR